MVDGQKLNESHGHVESVKLVDYYSNFTHTHTNWLSICEFYRAFFLDMSVGYTVVRLRVGARG